MSAIQKELIYTELRKYHLDEFPESFASSDMNRLLVEYRSLEDEVIAMLLGLVNGKSEYLDLSDNLKKFSGVVKQPNDQNDDLEGLERDHFISKAEQLIHILDMAKRGSFTARPTRKIRPSTRAVVVKVNKR